MVSKGVSAASIKALISSSSLPWETASFSLVVSTVVLIASMRDRREDRDV